MKDTELSFEDKIEAAIARLDKSDKEKAIDFLDSISATLEKLMVRELSLRKFAEVLSSVSDVKISHLVLRDYLKCHFSSLYEKYYTARMPSVAKKGK